MVFFVCEGCNESLKKNQVDKHAQRCRSCHAVTCVDCQVTFYGDDYVQHTTCVSEAEKYEKSLYKGPKVKVNPQDAWMNTVEQAVTNSSKAPHNIQTHLKRLGELNNIPRNQKKFENFIKNSLRLYNDNLILEIWKYLESFKPIADENPTINNKSVPSSSESIENHNEVSTTDKKVKKDKKEKLKSESSVTNESTIDDQQLITEDEEIEDQTSIKKKKKKDKKRKREEKERENEIETEDNEVENKVLSETDIDSDTLITEKKKKKKKKKNKRENDE